MVTSASVQPSGESGFTLLETLAALVVLAIALTSLFSAHTSSVRATHAGGDYTRAQMLADSLLAQTQISRAQPRAMSSGQLDKFRWKVTARPAEALVAPGPTAQERQWTLYRMRVEVTWPPTRSIALDTLRMVRQVR